MINIILNPRSGEGKKKKLFARALARFEERKQEVRVFETEKAGQAALLAHDLSQEGGDLVVIGGDGTLHEVINGFSDFENCALGLIPTGTGNDFAAAAGIPLEPEKAVDLILDTQPQFTEFMQFPQGVRGINVAGTGIDVEILKRCRASKVLRGRFQYIISLIISLCKFRNYKMKVRVNGKESTYNALIACVGNGYRIGGGRAHVPRGEGGRRPARRRGRGRREEAESAACVRQADEGEDPAGEVHLLRALRAYRDRAGSAADHTGRRRILRRAALCRRRREG